MFKKLLFIGLTFSSLCAWEIEKPFLRLDDDQYGLRLFHEDGSFYIRKDDGNVLVENYNIDKELRDLSNIDLQFLLGKKKLFCFEGRQYCITSLSVENILNPDVCSKDMVLLRRLNCSEDEELLRDVLKPIGYIKIKQLSDGDYVLRFHQILPGGGPGGAAAGAWIGKILVYTIGHGFIGVTAVATAVATGNPTAAPAVVAQMEAALAAEIEAASNVGAMIGTIVGGVATGPA